MKIEIRGVTIDDLTDDELVDLRQQLDARGTATGTMSVASKGRRLTAAEVAERLGVSREWVYDHADELGAEKLGAGPRPRLRFDPAKIHRSTPAGDPAQPSRTPRRRRSTPAPSEFTLQIRGRRPGTSV